MKALFWISVGVAAYVYVGYPAILRVWSALRSGGRMGPTQDAEPAAVSIVIAARNEGRRLPGRIDNLLALDYPSSRRQIVVVSDGSTDDTCEALSKYAGLVDVVAVPPGGKALALNAGVARAEHDILVFADARQAFAPDALFELAAPFADPSVGGVTGELVLDCEPPRSDDRRSHDRRESTRGARKTAAERRCKDRRARMLSTIGDGVGLYWRYEKSLRRLESEIGSTVGATGCIYALRRRLWTPLPSGTILDDVLAPMRAVMSGSRVIFNERARAFDRTSTNADAESRRKVRTLAGNYQILWLAPGLLVPWRNPVWVQYLSHKVGRLLVPYALLGAFFSSVALSATSSFYASVLGVEVAFYLLAGYGAWLDWRERAVTHRTLSEDGRRHAAREAA